MAGSTFYTRVGAAADVDAPIGVTVSVARTANDDDQARQVAQAFARANGQGQSFLQPGAYFNPQGLATREEPEDEPKSLWDHIGGFVSKVADPVLNALEWGTETTGNLMEASMRTWSQRTSDGFQLSDAAMGLTANPVWGWTQADWRENWDKSVAAEASVGQTMWLLTEQQLQDKGWIDGGSSNGIQASMELLDNPLQRARRQDYFAEGAAHWTTGVGDALWQVFMDPTIIAGKAMGGVRAARALLSADDVTQAARAAEALRAGEEVGELTGRASRTRNLVRELAESFESAENITGGVAAASRSRFLSQAADGGAIAYFMGRVGSIPGLDRAGRIAMREDAIYAGMGDAAALARVSERGATLGIELEKMTSRLEHMQVDDLLARADLDDMDALTQAFSRINDADLTVREVKAQLPQLRQEIDAISRIEKAGAPISGALRPAGQLAMAPTARDIAKVNKVVQNGPFMERISIVTGRHLPGTFKMSDPDAANVFHEAILRARRILPKNDPATADLQARLLQLEDDFVSTGVGAASKAPRGVIVARFDKLVDEIIATKYKLDKDAVSAVYGRMRNRRMGELQQIATRIYSPLSAGDVAAVHNGDEFFAFGGSVPEVLKEFGNPALRSQVEDWASIIDPRRLDQFAQAHLKNGVAGYAKFVKTSGLWEASEAALTAGNRLWKFGALLRPFAYFVRAQVDEQFRQLAMLGSRKYLANAQAGVRNGFHNLQMIDRAKAAAITQRIAQGSRIDDLERTLFIEHGKDLDNLASLADDDALKPLADELLKLRDEVSKPLDWTPSGEWARVRNTGAARRVGQAARVDSKGRLRRGKALDAYRNSDEFEHAIESMDAEDAMLGVLIGSTRGQIESLRKTGNWDLIPGTDEGNWTAAYLRAVNHQVRSDALGQRVLAGQSDEEIFDWFRSTPEGRAYLRDMHSTGAESAYAVVDRVRQHVDALLPENSAVRAAALERAVSLDDIKSAWAAPSLRPSVPGEMLQKDWKGRIVRGYEHVERSYFKWVASVPETMMTRHPFYASRFEMHGRDLLARTGLEEKNLTVKQLNELRAEAARLSRKDVERYLFDTSKQTRAGHFMRFISPFYGAWEDTMVKWGRIFGEKPETAAKFWDIVRAPNAGGFVVDRDGNRIDPLGNIRDEDGRVVGKAGIWDGYILIPLPDISLPGVGRLHEWAGADNLRISKNAANVIFQGDPFWLPGPGPVVAVPTNELLVNMWPEAYGDEGSENPILKWILPYGPTADSVPEQLLPSWAKAARDVLTQDSPRVDAVFAQLYQEQVNMERNGLTPELTDDQRIDLVSNRVRNWTMLRLMGTQMPFTWTPQSRLAFYKTEYDRYRREFGLEADERFAQDYPDYFDMAISLSVNETGLTATDESWGAIQAYRNDMARNPEYGWFWAGAANLTGQDFNQGVYEAQQRQEVGPGTSTRFRSSKDPLEAARDANVSAGWREYQQVSTQLRMALEQRGLRSFSANGAADLAEIRERFVADLSGRNPDWAGSYNEGGNPGRVTEFLSLMVDQLNSHPELRERGDGQAYMQYLTVREALREAMAQRGTGSLDAETNADLRQVWDAFTADLASRDLGFEQAWDRVLSRDDLSGDIY